MLFFQSIFQLFSTDFQLHRLRKKEILGISETNHQIRKKTYLYNTNSFFMFGKKSSKSTIDPEQLELIQNAQKRIKQKKRLYIHFVLFLIGSIFMIVANLIFKVGIDTKPLGIDWFVFPIVIWLFLLAYHFFSVYITNRFMGTEWEQNQLDKLVKKQQKRIEELKLKVEKENPLPSQTSTDAESSPEKKKRELTIIVAAGEDNAIGKDNELIWHLSDDLKRFKALTSGHCIIMGRKTFESFPNPLPNRTHIVITRQERYKVPSGVIVVNSLEDALDAAKNDKQPFIIGGGEIYKQALPYTDKIELTRVHASFDTADAFFPELDLNQWKETAHIYHPKDEKNDHAFSFMTYRKT